MKYIATFGHIDWGQSNLPDKRIEIEAPNVENAKSIAFSRTMSDYHLLSIKEKESNKVVFVNW